MNRHARLSLLTVLIGSMTGACATFGNQRAPQASSPDSRGRVIARAALWRPTTIPAMNLKTGPTAPGAFPFRAPVECTYLEKKLDGDSPKFSCVIGRDDEVKVKFGGNNGEVFGEVLATRLLWALGFGADRMYPVNVVCHGCPETLGGIVRPGDASRFDPAVIERKMEGREWPRDGKPGWSWEELDRIDPESHGSPRSHRDALKLLAVFLQHTDSKPVQQRILCLGTAPASRNSCSNPFLMLNDVGLTFGRANRTNSNDTGSVNLLAWRGTPVWRQDATCEGNLPKSLTGTLNNPVISEEGRRFLANLLVQLSDGQLHDLFEVARVELRLRAPGTASSGFATIDEWVSAFKEKRSQIVDRRCTSV
jgi:hypothetical protein